LLLVCGCFYLLRKDLDLAAALVLALALFKPQLPIILALALFAIGRVKFFVWFAALDRPSRPPPLPSRDGPASARVIRTVLSAQRIAAAVRRKDPSSFSST
jgi:hypothetical protein